jgi:uncharacterized membrane protein
MRLAGISVIGWIHTVACIAALVLGAMNLVATKGTRRHKLRGSAYAASMIVAMGLSLAIYRFDIPMARGRLAGPGVFGLFHWLAVATIFFTLLGYYAASRQGRGFWAYMHPIAMTVSYYLLIGGLINELFARVNALRPFAYTMVYGKPTFGSRAVGLTQFAATLAAAFILILFSIKVWRYRRGRAASSGSILA